MYIFIKAKPVNSNIRREIENVTNYALLRAGNIRWNKESNEVHIELRRRNIKGYKRKLFSSVLYPIYDKDFIKSLVRIRDVKDFTLVNRDKEYEEFVLLFGLTVTGDEIYFSSAQEYHGDVLLEGTIIIGDLDIEIIDL